LNCNWFKQFVQRTTATFSENYFGTSWPGVDAGAAGTAPDAPAGAAADDAATGAVATVPSKPAEGLA
jgi:hypothetical protein